MNANDIIIAIQGQIDAASPILERLFYLKAAPVFAGSDQKMGNKHYDKATISVIEERINSWQLKTRAVLAACFVGNNEHKHSFERTMVSPRLFYDAKEELTKEVREGRDVLSAIIEEVSLKTQLIEPETIAKAKSPMVFISHSSKDREFAEALVDMLEVLGFDNSNLFCSSIDGYGIGLSEDVFETLRYLSEKIVSVHHKAKHLPGHNSRPFES